MGDEFEYEKSIESSTLVASNYKTILHLPTIKKQIRNLFTESRDPAWHKRELRLKKKLGKKREQKPEEPSVGKEDGAAEQERPG